MRKTPISRTEAVVEEWISVGTFRAKEKITAKPQQASLGRLLERARADHQKK